MQLARFNRPDQAAADKNVQIEVSGTADIATLVPYLIGQGTFGRFRLDPNGRTAIALPAGNYLFHVGFIGNGGDCDIAVQVRTRSPDGPFPADPETGETDEAHIGQVTIYVVVTEA